MQYYRKKLKALALSVIAFAPVVVLAQIGPSGNTGLIEAIVNILVNVLRPIVFLLFGLAVILFMWGVVKFIANADNETERSKGKQFMVFGIIALTVMITIWGIVTILSETLGFGVAPAPDIPNLI